MKIHLTDLQKVIASTIEIEAALSVVITEAFNGVDFCTEDGNHLAVSMRDDGYEVHYYGKDFDAGWTEFKSGRLPKTQDTDNAGDLLQTAWGVIANVSRGDWSTQSDEWRHAALRFRDRYHLWLDEEVARHRRRTAPENEVVPNNTEEPLDDSATLRSYIFQAIGEASACWENLSGTGVYDVEHATKIANELCKNLGIEPLEQ